MFFALSSGAWAVIAAGVSAAAVLAAGYLSSTWVWRRERDERRRDERRNKYVAFLKAFNECAHRLGNLGDDFYGPRATDRQEASYFLDREVTRTSGRSSFS